MTTATTNKINAAIEKFGVALYKGDGYFFFYDLENSSEFNADKIPSVYSCQLRCMSLEAWIEHVETAIKSE